MYLTLILFIINFIFLLFNFYDGNTNAMILNGVCVILGALDMIASRKNF